MKAVINTIEELDKIQPVIHTTAIRRLAKICYTQIELADMQLVSQKIAEIFNWVN